MLMHLLHSWISFCTQLFYFFRAATAPFLDFLMHTIVLFLQSACSHNCFNSWVSLRTQLFYFLRALAHTTAPFLDFVAHTTALFLQSACSHNCSIPGFPCAHNCFIYLERMLTQLLHSWVSLRTQQFISLKHMLTHLLHSWVSLLTLRLFYVFREHAIPQLLHSWVSCFISFFRAHAHKTAPFLCFFAPTTPPFQSSEFL